VRRVIASILFLSCSFSHTSGYAILTLQSRPSSLSQVAEGLGPTIQAYANRKMQRKEEERQQQMKHIEEERQRSKLLNAVKQARTKNLPPEMRQHLDLIEAFADNPEMADKLMSQQLEHKKIQAQLPE